MGGFLPGFRGGVSRVMILVIHLGTHTSVGFEVTEFYSETPRVNEVNVRFVVRPFPSFDLFP